MTDRKRGAQPCNTNALKHGFYSRQFRQLDVSDLQAVSAGLADEIAALRVLIRRVIEMIDQEDSNLGTWLSTLQTLSGAMTTLSGLLRTEQVLTGNSSDMQTILSQALADLNKDLKL